MRKMLTVMSLALMVGLVVTPSVFAAGNAPSVNDNNRVVGVAGGNIFYNGLVPGTSASSMMNLGLPAGGGTSPGAGTGAAMASIAGLDKKVVASGAGTVNANGLQATINADGSYNLVAGADFKGAWIVSFGNGGDGAQLAAVEAAKVDIAASVTVEAGKSVLWFASAPVAVTAGSEVTVSLNYNTPSGTVNIAAVAFDGGIDGSAVKYTNPGGAVIASGVKKNVATSFVSTTGSVFAGYQVYNGGAAAVTVQLSDLKVVKGGPVTAFATAVDVALPALNTWAGNILADAGTVGPVAAGAGLKLPGAGGNANAYAMATVGVGELVARAKVAGAGTGTFVLTVVDAAGAYSFASFVPAASVATKDVVTSGTVNAGTAIVVVQATGFEATVNSVTLKGAKDGFDAALLGM
jgi:hypothetical protein